ncbi:helix-turn-helix transcriptional regulator [Elizabethkingia anophelis]|nr:helix-turn-helix transcriptional regulator [Elizabethkingia anophelis]
MKKIRPINSDRFLTSIKASKDSEGIFYCDYFRSTTEEIKNFAIGPYFWIVADIHNMKIECVSDNVGKMTPFTKEAWLASTSEFFIELFHPEDMSYLMAAFEFAIGIRLSMAEESKSQLRINFYVRMLNADRVYRWILLNVPEICINELNEIEASLFVVYDLSHLNITSLPLLTVIDYTDRKIQYYKHFEREIKKIEKDLSIPVITKREKEILNLMVQGYNTPQISEQLFISYHTVENHKRNLRKKTNTRTSSELIVYVIKYNLLFI